LICHSLGNPLYLFKSFKSCQEKFEVFSKYFFRFIFFTASLFFGKIHLGNFIWEDFALEILIHEKLAAPNTVRAVL